MPKWRDAPSSLAMLQQQSKQPFVVQRLRGGLVTSSRWPVGKPIANSRLAISIELFQPLANLAVVFAG
jgi:hypothetical protein